MREYDYKAIAESLATDLDPTYPMTFDLSDGRTITARMHYDEGVTPFDFDCVGSYDVVPTDRNTGYSYRPDGFDGNARKIHTRDDDYWWQPPADIATDRALVDSMYSYLRGFFNGDWCYVGITIEVGNAQSGLWGIDHGAGTYAETQAYLIETLTELVSEALNDPTANVCPCCKRQYA